MIVDLAGTSRAKLVSPGKRHDTSLLPNLFEVLWMRKRPELADDDDLTTSIDIEIDELDTAIRNQVQIEGDFLMSATRVNGRPVLRVSVMNHATRAEHIEGLVESVLRIGRSMSR
ncbi:MAG: hypothetical protein ACI87H_002410 [Gammaproteobacteria bacterium]